MSEQRFPSAPKTWVHHRELSISGPPPKGDHKQARLVFGRGKNCVKMTVYTGDPSMVSERNKYGTIEGTIFPVEMGILISILHAIERGEPPPVDEIVVNMPTFVNNRPSDEWKGAVALKVKVDDQGLYFGLINVRYEGAPKIRFSLTPAKSSSLRVNGTPASSPAINKVVAGAWATMFGMMLSDTVQHYAHPEPKDNGNRGGGNGGGQKYSNAGQVSGGSSIDDDDVQF